MMQPKINHQKADFLCLSVMNDPSLIKTQTSDLSLVVVMDERFFPQKCLFVSGPEKQAMHLYNNQTYSKHERSGAVIMLE